MREPAGAPPGAAEPVPEPSPTNEIYAARAADAPSASTAVAMTDGARVEPSERAVLPDAGPRTARAERAPIPPPRNGVRGRTPGAAVLALLAATAAIGVLIWLAVR